MAAMVCLFEGLLIGIARGWISAARFAIVAGTVASVFAMAPAQAQQEILIFTGTDPNFLPVVVAAEKGFFKDERLKVSHRMFPSGADAMLAFRSIKAQFVAAGDLPSVILWGQGGAVGVAPFFASSDNLYGVVKAEIKAPSDLKGKKIAVRKSSTSDYFLQTYLRTNNVDPGAVQVVDLSPPEMVPALVRNQIDGFFIWRPYPSQAKKILGDKVRVMTTAGGYYVERMYMSAAKDFATSNPQVVESVVRALKRAIDYAYANPDDAATVVATKVKTEPAIVKEVLVSKPFNLNYDKKAGEELERLSRFLVETGRSQKPISSVDVFDPRFLRSVDPALVQ